MDRIAPRCAYRVHGASRTRDRSGQIKFDDRRWIDNIAIRRDKFVSPTLFSRKIFQRNLKPPSGARTYYVCISMYSELVAHPSVRLDGQAANQQHLYIKNMPGLYPLIIVLETLNFVFFFIIPSN